MPDENCFTEDFPATRYSSQSNSVCFSSQSSTKANDTIGMPNLKAVLPLYVAPMSVLADTKKFV